MLVHYYKKEYIELVRTCFQKLKEISEKSGIKILEKGDTITFEGSDYDLDYDLIIKKNEQKR